jgi:hypothetical protein
MLASLAGYAVDIRHPRVHVPAFADSYLPAVTVSLKAGLYTYNGSGADGINAGAFPRRSPLSLDVLFQRKHGVTALGEPSQVGGIPHPCKGSRGHAWGITPPQTCPRLHDLPPANPSGRMEESGFAASPEDLAAGDERMRCGEVT